jgi:glycosyltransferase involved in cell wall biosynthesis
MLAETVEHLRILHIVPYFKPAWAYGGPVRVVYELSKRLIERGHEVLVYTTDALDAHSRSEAGEQIIDGVRVRRFRNLSNRLAWNRLFIPLGFGGRLAQTMQRFDVIHLHEFRTLQNVYALPALHKAGRPYILMPHGGLPPELGRKGVKRIYDLLYGQRLLEGAARLHALTEMERQQYLALGLPDSRIIIIPNGIDVTAFDHGADASAFKRQYGVRDDQPVVGFLGRLNSIKGPEFLVEAFAQVLAHKPNAVLMLVGPDDGAQRELESQVDRLGIREAVRFTGYIGDNERKAAAYRAFDLYVLPSRYENQSTTVLESLLNATPSILTDRCGLTPQLVQSGVARAVPFGDVEALAREIMDILENRDRARAQAEHGRRYVVEHFNWETLTDQWIEVYRACVQETVC